LTWAPTGRRGIDIFGKEGRADSVDVAAGAATGNEDVEDSPGGLCGSAFEKRERPLPGVLGKVDDMFA
jgi:hypothetical protein